jgi:hypothetical protein
MVNREKIKGDGIRLTRPYFPSLKILSSHPFALLPTGAMPSEPFQRIALSDISGGIIAPNSIGRKNDVSVESNGPQFIYSSED